jgi:hypothetical protein
MASKGKPATFRVVMLNAPPNLKIKEATIAVADLDVTSGLERNIKDGSAWAPVCTWYTLGNCRNGNDCRYIHPKWHVVERCGWVGLAPHCEPEARDRILARTDPSGALAAAATAAVSKPATAAAGAAAAASKPIDQLRAVLKAFRSEREQREPTRSDVMSEWIRRFPSAKDKQVRNDAVEAAVKSGVLRVTGTTAEPRLCLVEASAPVAAAAAKPKTDESGVPKKSAWTTTPQTSQPQSSTANAPVASAAKNAPAVGPVWGGASSVSAARDALQNAPSLLEEEQPPTKPASPAAKANLKQKPSKPQVAVETREETPHVAASSTSQWGDHARYYDPLASEATNPFEAYVSSAHSSPTTAVPSPHRNETASAPPPRGPPTAPPPARSVAAAPSDLKLAPSNPWGPSPFGTDVIEPQYCSTSNTSQPFGTPVTFGKLGSGPAHINLAQFRVLLQKAVDGQLDTFRGGYAFRTALHSLLRCVKCKQPLVGAPVTLTPCHHIFCETCLQQAALDAAPMATYVACPVGSCSRPVEALALDVEITKLVRDLEVECTTCRWEGKLAEFNDHHCRISCAKFLAAAYARIDAAFAKSTDYAAVERDCLDTIRQLLGLPCLRPRRTTPSRGPPRHSQRRRRNSGQRSFLRSSRTRSRRSQPRTRPSRRRPSTPRPRLSRWTLSRPTRTTAWR